MNAKRLGEWVSTPRWFWAVAVVFGGWAYTVTQQLAGISVKLEWIDSRLSRLECASGTGSASGTPGTGAALRERTAAHGPIALPGF